MSKQNKPSTNPTASKGRIFSFNSICNELSISRQTAYNWIKHGHLKPHRLGGKVFFLEAEILESIQNEKDGK
ncbi:MAG: helix-turn-helix domain-containing protein [Bacteroidia bacterium]|nr:helix-turn-helix domain-containing protein [Bacteroidia bacterium]